MTEHPGTPLWPRILGRHYDLVSWDAILNSYPRTPLWPSILGRHYELVSWDAIMT